MVLINEVNCLDLQSLLDWMVFRQGVEGGFQGRTNKLVDGCYSFWQVIAVGFRSISFISEL
nr:protein farnesyltransferase subunit beta isoform X2 [Ipomoea batatas]